MEVKSREERGLEKQSFSKREGLEFSEIKDRDDEVEKTRSFVAGIEGFLG